MTLSPELLEQTFDRYYPAIFHYYRFRGVDVSAANELTAAVFERGLENLAEYQPEGGSLPFWLFSIARGLGHAYWKAESPRSSIALEEGLPLSGDPSFAQTEFQVKDREGLLQAFQTLDERSRDVLALKLTGLLSNRQIAELTELVEGSVTVILYRSLLKVRHLLILPAQTNHE